MRTIILDGYNVIHKLPELSIKLDESLEVARTALVMHLSNWKKKYLYSNICIVFDGKDNAMPEYPKTKLCGIDCRFTKTEESADDHIIAIIGQCQDTSEITVISDDNKIKNNCKAFGVKVESPSFLQNTAKKLKHQTDRPLKRISSKNEREITDLYTRYLKQKGTI